MKSQKLPTFLIVGAAKAGTTSLYHYLGDHPDVFTSPIKEPFFFSFMKETPDFRGPYDEEINASIITDWAEYIALFKEAEEEQIRVEASNAYLYFSERTAPRIREYLGSPKILISLRNPVHRAFSHYRQFLMLGHENRPFEGMLELEEERERRNWRWHYQLIQQSLYYEDVNRYINTFGRENVHILFFKDFVEKTSREMKKIASFLSIDPNFYIDYEFEVHNQSGVPRSKFLHQLLRGSNWVKEVTRPFTPNWLRGKLATFLESMNYDSTKAPILKCKTERQLYQRFREDIDKLEQLLQRDLSAWRFSD